jgi:hypothetical protein
MPSSKRASVVVVKRKNKPNPNRRRAAKARVTFVGPRLRNGKTKRKGRTGKTRGIPKGARGNDTSMSMVTDGVNVGSIFKNTTAETVTFKTCREKFMDLVSPDTDFHQLLQLYINPGNSILFPIFSNIARNYEQYKCDHLKIFYRTKEYMASGSNVSAGLVGLGTNFDPDAPNFGSLTELENYEHATSGPPFAGLIEHDILAHHKKRFGSAGRGNSNDLSLNNYFVNYSENNIAPGATPAKFYDMGNFQTVIDGCQAGKIGELWIEYRFTMIRRLQYSGSSTLFTYHGQVSPGSANAANPYMNMAQVSSNFPTDTAFTFPEYGTYCDIVNCPAGTYFIYQGWVDGDQEINGTAATANLVVGCSQLARFALGGVESVATEGTSILANGQRATYATVINVPASGHVQFGVSGPGTMGNAISDFIFTAVPAGYMLAEKLSKEDLRLEEKLTKQDAKIERLEKMLQALSPPSTPSYEHVVRGIKLPSPEEQKDSLSAKIVPQSDLSNSTVSLLTSFLKTHTK